MGDSMLKTSNWVQIGIAALVFDAILFGIWATVMSLVCYGCRGESRGVWQFLHGIGPAAFGLFAVILIFAATCFVMAGVTRKRQTKAPAA